MGPSDQFWKYHAKEADKVKKEREQKTKPKQQKQKHESAMRPNAWAVGAWM